MLLISRTSRLLEPIGLLQSGRATPLRRQPFRARVDAVLRRRLCPHVGWKCFPPEYWNGSELQVGTVKYYTTVSTDQHTVKLTVSSTSAHPQAQRLTHPGLLYTTRPPSPIYFRL
ncbi:hypothetical protein L226DRAFT_152901 [Lentinus tigrinus ALCF2SS1-7]|uniref:uncharacterized protein n=1 Tax=Lentinus tigrinus ALCF2SS1-7 TaxID=1328758 RepID=UPI0011662A5F|nr:hypothetical protein L226DRAFT_152901 [Lentinus tigrinus ALCF2SS1-7]